MGAYPNAVKSFTNPLGSNTQNSPSHAQQHTDENDEIVAIETELGTVPKGTYTSVKDRLDKMPLVTWPIGAVYTSIVSTDPGTLFGGTWVAFGAGKVLVGHATSGTFNVAAETTGGEETHLLTAVESGLPAHTHVERYSGNDGTTAGSFMSNSNASAGPADSDVSTAANTAAPAVSAHNNLQPYIVVYFFKRTA